MGLFNIFKKKKREAAVLPSFVLLDCMEFDVSMFVADFKNDWGIEIALDDEDKKESDMPVIVTHIDGMMVSIALMPGPIPDDEAISQARTNLLWPDAVAMAEKHEANVLVAVMGGDKPLKNIAMLHAKLCASCLKQHSAIAISTAGSVLEPRAYMDAAKLAAEKDVFPILNHIFFGIYSSDGELFSGYTYGLESLGKQDIEIVGSTASAGDIYNFMVDIAAYIMDSDITLKPGETIGFTSEQKLTITESKGIAVNGKTLKIGF